MGPECHRHVGHAHGGTRMARVGLLYGIDGQDANGIGHQGVIWHHDLGGREISGCHCMPCAGSGLLCMTWARLSSCCQMSRFCASANDPQLAISGKVRKQPRHHPSGSCIWHTDWQGEGRPAGCRNTPGRRCSSRSTPMFRHQHQQQRQPIGVPARLWPRAMPWRDPVAS